LGETRRKWLENFAIHYIDSQSQNAAEEIVKFARDGKTVGGKVIEGAKVILATVPSAKAMSAVLGGLSVNGKLIIVGASVQYHNISFLILSFIIPKLSQVV
jgi:D-arabinose 1-dehydrogenase-like Zn-dependent alcohol dehydrogenase